MNKIVPGRIIFSVSIYLFLLCPHPLFSDQIWDRAMDFYSRSESWSAGRMFLESRELDRKGNLKELWEIEYLLPPEGEDSEWEIVSILKDGRPATERELEKRDNNSERGPPDDGYFEGVNVICLDKGEKERVLPVNTGKTVIFQGERLSVYEFTHVYESGAETAGEVLISPGGFPRKMEYEFTNLPFYMKKMKSSFTFKREGEAALVESMQMEGHVSLIVFNLRFMTRMIFSDYHLKGRLIREGH